MSFQWQRANEYAPGMQVPRPVGPGDPRIPPPAPDVVNLEGPTLILPESTTNKRETTVKFGIYATKGDKFIFAALDEDNDPVQSVTVDAGTIETVLKPMLEIAGHKIVNYAGMDYTEAASAPKVRRLPKRETA